MRGLLRIGSSLALRYLPRLGAAGDSRGFIPLPGFCGRPAGDGPGSGVARGAFGMCLETSFLWWWLSASDCRQSTVPARGDRMSLRSACRVQRRDPARRLPKAPTGAAFSRTALRALPSAFVGVQPTTVPGVPCRGAGKAAASSRCALPSRRASVVTTGEPARLGSDDALRRRINGPETRTDRGFPQLGAKEPKSARKCQKAKTRFFLAWQKKYNPDVRPCTQGEIACPVSGARVRFVARLLGDRLVG